MTHCVNTSVNAVKVPALHSPGAPPFVDTCRLELCDGDNPVLVRRQPGDYGVRISIATFRPHVGALSDNARDFPPSSPVFRPAYPNVKAYPVTPGSKVSESRWRATAGRSTSR